ncbi:reverse transcriptase domain-containing protein, partial [Tanacetum coccineum]
LVECFALADLGTSINLMHLSIWKKLSLPELTPTQMILELEDRSTTNPSELTLRVDDEAITFKVGQTSRYSYNDVVLINRIDVIDVACDFIFEEIETCLTNGSIPPGIDDDDFDLEGDLLLLEKLLNDDPSSPLPPKELHDTFKFLLTRKTKRRPPSLALMGHFPTDACLSAYVLLPGAGYIRSCLCMELLTVFYTRITTKSGQVRFSNHGFENVSGKGIRSVDENRASWSDKLDDALWAFCTAFKTPIGCTPYKLVYEKACHLLIELEHKTYWALKHCNYDLVTAGDH